jgi:tryptophan-rich sensory protein
MEAQHGQQPAAIRGWRSVAVFVVTLAVTFATASIGATNLPGPWYEGLAKPSLTPPNWVFGPVWTLLYLMMGVAAGLVWRKAGLHGARVALGLYLLQLVLNSAWSWLFFGLHQPGWAFADIVLLWLAIVATILAFQRISAAAALMMTPYLVWVSFASYLNFMLWRLNA